MLRQLGLPAWVALYLIAVPLAIVVGVSVSDPLAPTSLMVLAILVMLALVPLLLRFYHESLIISWNSALVVFFLPGRPTLAMLLTGLCLLMAVLNRALARQPLTLPGRPIAIPLILLGLVVMATAAATGGLGGRALGSDLWGAKRYAGVLFGIAGFFALTSRAIPPERITLIVSLFILSAVTAALSDLAYALDWYFLFLVFATDVAFMQVASEHAGTFIRLTGVCWASWAVFNFMFARYGVRGVLDLSQPWRLALVIVAFLGTMVGGYRSYIFLAAVMLTILGYLERAHRSTLMIVGLAFTIAVGAILLPNVRSLPLSIQRSLSILPVDVDPIARTDAQGTLDWRLEMWKVVLPEVPKYFLVGKGFAYSGTDYYLTQEAYRRGMLRSSYEDTLISGNYHNGFLTLIIPFGVWGFAAFAWFAVASIRALRSNYLHGPPHLANINRFLFALFVTRLVFYLTIYGQFDLDLPILTGIVALSIAVNRGILGRTVPIPDPSRSSSPLPATTPTPALNGPNQPQPA